MPFSQSATGFIAKNKSRLQLTPLQTAFAICNGCVGLRKRKLLFENIFRKLEMPAPICCYFEPVRYNTNHRDEYGIILMSAVNAAEKSERPRHKFGINIDTSEGVYYGKSSRISKEQSDVCPAGSTVRKVWHGSGHQWFHQRGQPQGSASGSGGIGSRKGFDHQCRCRSQR